MAPSASPSAEIAAPWTYGWTTTRNLPREPHPVLYFDLVIFYLYSWIMLRFIHKYQEKAR